MNRITFIPDDPLPSAHYNGVQQSVEGLLRTIAGLLGLTGGYVGSATDNATVTEASPTTTTTVKVAGPATLWIAPILGGTPGGVPFYKAAAEDVTVPALNTTAGQSRRDIVVATVNLGSVDTYTYSVVQGTPATTGAETDPATPVNSIRLARITRAHGTTTILNAQITDLRVAVKVTTAHQA